MASESLKLTVIVNLKPVFPSHGTSVPGRHDTRKLLREPLGTVPDAQIISTQVHSIPRLTETGFSVAIFTG